MKKRYSYILMSAALFLTGTAVNLAAPQTSSSTVQAAKKEISATEWNMDNLISLNGTGISIFNYHDLNISSISKVCNVTNQAKIAQMLDELKNTRQYDLNEPLVISNPFLTNPSSLYLYFKTSQPTKISYTVTTSGYYDYSANVYNPEGEYSTSHEFQLVGAVAGENNIIKLTATAQDGTKSTRIINFKH